jgi:ATP-dependent protease ClpP protease subunit
MKTCIILFIIGILVSATSMSQSSVVELTSDNHVTFFGPVTTESVSRTQLDFSILDSSLPKDKLIYLVLNTPGGSLFDGLNLINYIKTSKRHVKVVCLYCASMGYNFLQSFNERIVASGSYVMMHPATVYIEGKYPEEFNSRLEPVQGLIKYFDTTNAKRIGVTVPKFQQMINNEINMNGFQAVEGKHADTLALIKCSPDLIKQKTNITIVDGNVKYELVRSRCPLIINSLSEKQTKVEQKTKTQWFRTKNWRF